MQPQTQQNNKPVIVPSTLKSLGSLGKVIGDTGTSIMGGIITGEEYNVRLQGKWALRQFDIMRRSDATVEAALELIKQPILNNERSIAGINNDPQSDFKQRFFEREIFKRKVQFDEAAEQALTFLEFGFSVMEFTLELTEFEGVTLIGLKEISFRKQISIDRWETEDNKPGVTQVLDTVVDGRQSTRSIPAIKLLHWVNKREGDNHEGISLLRYVYKDWDFKDKLGLVHAIGLEKGAIPTPVLGIPAGSFDTEDERRATESLQQYRSNDRAYIKKPAGWDLDKFDLSGQTLDQLLPSLKDKDRQIFMGVLAGFMALGSSDSSGSRAVGDVQYKPYVQKVSSINKRFEAPFNKLIQLISDLNWSDNSHGYCKISSSRFQDDDITALANAVKSFVDAGVITPEFELEQHLRKSAHLPEASDDLKEEYDKKRELRLNPPAPVAVPDTKDVVDPKKKTEAAIKRAKQSQSELIDVIIRA